MNATLLCLAAALFVLPSSSARRRLRRGVPDAAPRPIPRALVAGVVVVVLTTVVVWAGITPAVAGATVAATVVGRRRSRRRAAELDRQRRMLLSGLDTVIADLRVGTHPADACETAARETAGSVAGAFRVAAARARLGGSAAHGLRSAAASSDGDGVADSLDRVADAWAVSDRHGLALAELLGAARVDLAARMRIRARTEAGLAGARATATVLAGLPVLGVGLGQLMGAAPLGILLTGGLGGVMLVVGTALVCAGLLWTDRIAARVGT
ncbi:MULTISPECIES: type II secretion system F family protein [Rhodococcus]|uniref:Type II secretion system F family protein n=1 Tax=Rhodococcus rhodochrous TaxID=1829 RepID=A0AAW4XPB9_RHORH|nr:MULTISPECIES: type II secretion system F family protein [Rhodococcus]MCD2114525.1 type II secretion system F family protein [Rhodococcus rhodochrous]QHG81085.1 secretion protein F [Rhodococcus rhodochrous]QOH54905.1 secretion protein F [Rhodococcus rhodochrous]WAL46961.1 type II secretion system F family protein [Rhodococcus pyridinivorans]